jgi:hypothetical protein
VKGPVLLFAATLFWSAALLFCVEPMIARMLLPLLGGAPAVWVTCMLFFQVALLLGYGYAHFLSVRLTTAVAVGLHLALLALPFFLLPIAFDPRSTEAWTASANPTLPLLWLLAARVGLPFFVLSASGPLLQKWFSSLGHPSGKDPYFLYAASNLGSMLALIAYPVVLEPTLGLLGQSRLWQVGYWGLAGLVVACGVAALRRRAGPPPSQITPPPWPPASQARQGEREPSSPGPHAPPSLQSEEGGRGGGATVEEVGRGGRVLWITLSFIPSSFLLGVTTYVTTDIAPVPLFWVLPLALYLLTFILVFARKPVSPRFPARALPFAVSVAMLAMLSEVGRPGWLIILVHLGLFFLAALVCHGALARMRPPARLLTEFYLCMSVGGALGGVFNALVAPLVFNRLLEYPLIIVVACVARAAVDPSGMQAPVRKDLLVPLGVGALSALLVVLLQRFGMEAGGPAVAIMFGPALLLNYSSLHRPLRFALGVLAIFLASALYAGTSGTVIHSERGFFGVVAVSRDPTGHFLQIVHGDTVHGRQNIDPALRDEPLVYYYRTGPVGQILARYDESPATPEVGVIGLGAGSMAAYARPGEKWTFYEIDPIVVRIAKDPAYFTFLHDAFKDPGALAIELGDGRVRLKEAPDGGYGLLVLDAFSSDAIPMHLVTREALALFLQKLAPRGLMALHVSNRYLNLYPVFGDLARDAGVVAFVRRDTNVSDAEEALGKLGSVWIVMGRDEAVLGSIATDTRWHRLEGKAGRRLWTDDYSNLLGAFRW